MTTDYAAVEVDYTQPATITPPSWDTATYPTAVEWLTWLEQQTPEARLAIADQVLDGVLAAGRCIELDHDSYPAELEHQRTGLLAELYRVQATATRYRAAWSSARRRARQLLEALDTYADVPIALTLGETTRPLARAADYDSRQA